nr:hypothetical protein [Stackebrandtia endophytica]
MREALRLQRGVDLVAVADQSTQPDRGVVRHQQHRGYHVGDGQLVAEGGLQEVEAAAGGDDVRGQFDLVVEGQFAAVDLVAHRHRDGDLVDAGGVADGVGVLFDRGHV